MGIKLLIFSPYGSYRIFFGEKRVFILYIFPYLHLGSPFPLSVLFSFIKSNPQQYRFIIMSRIISPENLYSKIYEFLFLFNHMHDFLPFYLFIYLFIFPGVYTSSASKIVKIAHQQTLGLLLSCFWTVTVWPLLRFLTISGVIELRFKRD